MRLHRLHPWYNWVLDGYKVVTDMVTNKKRRPSFFTRTSFLSFHQYISNRVYRIDSRNMYYF